MLSGRDLLSRALEADRGLAGRLAALSPVLGRFVSGGLPGSVAGLVTLADMARIARVPEDEFLAFVNCRAGGVPDRAPAPAEPRPEWMAALDGAEDVASLDVTPLIAAGTDPFTRIMSFLDDLGPGQPFRILAPFDPVPLRRVLSARGYASHARRAEAGHWSIWFHRVSVPTDGIERDGQDGDARIWSEDDGVHIDVRGLDAPRPLVAIVELIERPDCGDWVVVHHDRDPVFLFPELTERGWDWQYLDADPGEIRLRLGRSGA